MRAASPLSGQVPLLFLLAFLGTAWPQRVGSDSVRIAARAKMLVDRARFQAENAEVHCQDVRDCPDAVGLWAATTGKSSFQCTAFLIDSIHAVSFRSVFIG